MNLNKSDLLNLPVFTQSNVHLGKVCDFEVDPVTHMIQKYHIRSGGLIEELLQKELLVSKDQVISLNAEKMIVEDGVVPVKETKKEIAKESAVAN
jgi:hypothetical protein